MNVNRGKAHGRKGKASTRSKSSLYDYLYKLAITAPGNDVMFIGFALIEYDLFPGGGILT